MDYTQTTSLLNGLVDRRLMLLTSAVALFMSGFSSLLFHFPFIENNEGSAVFEVFENLKAFQMGKVIYVFFLHRSGPILDDTL